MTEPGDILVIAREFTEAPGARNVDEGKSSGEEFLRSMLNPRFTKAKDKNLVLLVDLDNTEGYATSFLEEAFGGLARIHGTEVVLKHLDFKSIEEPLLIEEILKYIKDARR